MTKKTYTFTVNYKKIRIGIKIFLLSNALLLMTLIPFFGIGGKIELVPLAILGIWGLVFLLVVFVSIAIKITKMIEELYSQINEEE